MRTVILAPALAVMIAAFAACEDKKGWTEISIGDLEAAMRSKSVAVFDNNPKAVYDKRHLPGSTWLNAGSFTEKDLPSDKGTALVFYCMNDH